MSKIKGRPAYKTHNCIKVGNLPNGMTYVKWVPVKSNKEGF